MADQRIPPVNITIGDLEARAGIGPTHDERFAFWSQFSHLRAGSFEAGRKELHRRIREIEEAKHG
jgi:hypothetical protein